MAELTTPTILPSGNTIQENYFDDLIRRRSLDPFNKNLRVQLKIVNRFVLNVKEVLDNSQQKVAIEVDKRREAEQAKIRAQQNSKSVEIQADILIRSEDDIALIDSLKKKKSRLRTKKKNLDLQVEKLNQENKQLNQKIYCIQQDYNYLKDLTPNSSYKFILSMLNQSKGISAYNSTSLCGYLIFASMRNQFAVGVCYLIRLMYKLYLQEAERKRNQLIEFEIQ